MEQTPLNCASVAELLPWYLNGTLEPEKASFIEAHLEACRACRQEHRDTALAAAAYAAHPSAIALVDHAFHRLAFGKERDQVERHLRFCPACAEEVALIAESRDSLAALERGEGAEPGSAELLPFPVPEERSSSSSGLLRWAAAAAIATLVAGTAWRMNRSDTGPSGLASIQPGSATTVGRLEKEKTAVDALRQRWSATEPASWQLAAGPPTQLLPSEFGDAATLLLPPEGETILLFVEDLDAETEDSFIVRIFNAKKHSLWQQENLFPGSDGRLSLTMPSESLPEGTHALHLFSLRHGSETPLGGLSFHVRREP